MRLVQFNRSESSMPVITDLPETKIVEDSDIAALKGKATRSFFLWLKSVFLICFSVQQSGPTSQRPTDSLWIGRRYFDTDLNTPVYLSSINPNVWVYGSGSASGIVVSVTGTLPITSTGGKNPDIGINVFGPSGSLHSTGAVPDPGPTAGIKNFLREDATWHEVVPVFGTQQPVLDPYFDQVSLLLHFNEAPGSTTFVDGSIYHQPTAITNASGGTLATQSSVIKFGAGALECTGLTTGDMVSTTGTGAELAMGTGDFTFEGWYYTTSASVAVYNIIGTNFAGVTGMSIGQYLTGLAIFGHNNGASPLLIGSDVVTDHVWHHIALCRQGNTITLYLDGISQGTITDTVNYSVPLIQIVAAPGSIPLKGFLDDIRITKGVARYVSNFTPPTEQFPEGGLPTTGPRMMDDYTNTVVSNRYIFQSSVANGITDIGATPNGTATTGSFTAYNNTDVNNSSYLQIEETSTSANIISSFYGGGSALPINIFIGTTNILTIASTGLSVLSKFTIDTNGNITKLNNITTSFPASNAVGYLTNNGSGTYTLTSIVPIASGGTSFSSYTTGDVIYASSSTALAKRAIGSTGNVLTVSGGLPVWSPPATSGTVTHTTGALTANAVVLGNGTADIKVLASLGTTTTLLHGNASGAPTFSAVSLSADVTGNLAVTNLNSGTSASSTTFWCGNGTWAAPAGTVAGSTTQIQYNNAGAFGASASFTWTDSTKVLNFSSVASRITSDMNNATLASRFAFQNSVANQPTILGIIPNGTSPRAALNLYSDSALTNGSSFQLNLDTSIGTIGLNSGSFGTGTAKPFAFNIGGTDYASITTGGLIANLAFTAGASGFSISSTGNITKINGATTSWPSSNSAGVLTNDASGNLTWKTVGTLQKQVIAATGTFTIPTGTLSTTQFKFTIIGGGGGGGGGNAGGVGGGGGGGGATAVKWLTGLTAANTITTTIGAAGASGMVASTGGTGGSSSISSGTQTITTVTAAGGLGGVGQATIANTTKPNQGGAGGASTSGDLNISGTAGVFGLVVPSSPGDAFGGSGGPSTLGGGGQGGIDTTGNINGGNGSNYGAGGGGGGAVLATANGVGGAGGVGVIIIEWNL